MSAMRRIFLKTDNHIKGRYFAELTNKWDKFDKWFLADARPKDTGQMLSTHNQWLVQTACLWRANYNCSNMEHPNFVKTLNNIFSPILKILQFLGTSPRTV